MSGFDPKSYLEQADGPTFDPHSYIAEDSQPKSDLSDSLMAGGDHFANAVTMGYLPQLEGITTKIASKVLPNPTGDVDEKLKAQGFNIQEAPDPTYTQARDAAIARIAKEGNDHPIASAVGTVGGIISGGAATGAALGALGAGAKAAQLTAAAKAAKAAGDVEEAAQLGRAALAARLASGIKTGAAMGAITNPGDTEGEIDPFQLGARVDNAKTGAITGGAVQSAVEALPYVGKGLGYAAKKIAGAVSGVPQAEIDNYATQTDKINDLINQTGGDMTDAADKVRREMQSGIQATKNKLNGQISKAVSNAPVEKVHDLDPIVSPLEKQRQILLSQNQNEEANQLGTIIDKVKAFGVDKDPVYGVDQYTGKVNAKDLNNIKGLLQDIAQPAYQQNGQMFNYAKSSQVAAKYGAAAARKVLNQALPEVATANNQLAAMHSIEGNLNRNLLAAGKSDSALFAAGAGQNQRNLKMLQQLGNLSGVDAAQQAKNLATAKTFANPALLPTDATGKSATRMLLAAGAGHLLAGPAGYAAGALASPAAVKLGINVANGLGKVAAPVAQYVANNSPAIMGAAQRLGQSVTTPSVNQSAPEIPIDQETLGIFKQNPSLIDSIANPALKASLMKRLNRSPADGTQQTPDAPAKGEDLWAQQGLSKLGIQDQDLQQRLLSDPKGKQLLIQASDLSPGSKAFKNIQIQIQKGWGGK